MWVLISDEVMCTVFCKIIIISSIFNRRLYYTNTILINISNEQYNISIM